MSNTLFEEYKNQFEEAQRNGKVPPEEIWITMKLLDDCGIKGPWEDSFQSLVSELEEKEEFQMLETLNNVMQQFLKSMEEENA